MSTDHKPDLDEEKERILKAGGFIHAGRVNGSLNLARAIGTSTVQLIKSVSMSYDFVLTFETQLCGR